MTKHTQEEIVAAHIRAAKITLEAVLGLGAGFAPMIMVMRGGETVVNICPPTGDGQTIYQVAQIAADGYWADEILMVIDTYAAHELINPYTFQPWRRGEMEDLAVNHRGVERGWVRDAIMLLFVSRSGKPEMFTLPYRRAEGGVTWLEDEEKRSDGYMVAGGMLTRVFEPCGIFPAGKHRPTDAQMQRFLEGIGAEVLAE